MWVAGHQGGWDWDGGWQKPPCQGARATRSWIWVGMFSTSRTWLTNGWPVLHFGSVFFTSGAGEEVTIHRKSSGLVPRQRRARRYKVLLVVSQCRASEFRVFMSFHVQKDARTAIVKIFQRRSFSWLATMSQKMLPLRRCYWTTALATLPLRSAKMIGFSTLLEHIILEEYAEEERVFYVMNSFYDFIITSGGTIYLIWATNNCRIYIYMNIYIYIYIYQDIHQNSRMIFV